MTNHTRHTLRLAIGLPVIFGFLITTFAITQVEPRTPMHWLLIGLTAALLVVMIIVPRLFPWQPPESQKVQSPQS